MRFAKIREVFGTLHFRLTMWHTATVLFMVVVTLLAVREGVRSALLQETDQLLSEDAREMSLVINEFLPDVEQIEHALERQGEHARASGLVRGVARQPGQSSLAQRVDVRVAASSQPAAQERPARHARRPARVAAGSAAAGSRRQSNSHWFFARSAGGRRGQAHPTDVDRRRDRVVALAAGWILAGRSSHSPAGADHRHHGPTAPQQPRRAATTARHAHELDRLSLTVNGLLDRIAAYLEQNRQFTANAAHELRSPLAAIQNSLEVALGAERTTEEYKDLIGETLEECGGLRDLVNQLLQLAESDAGRIEIGPHALQLDQVIQKACEMFAGVAEAADSRLTIGCLEGDAGLR